MNFIRIIYWNFIYWTHRFGYKFAVWMRGEQYVVDYLYMVEQEYEPCMNCQQYLIWLKENYEPKICFACLRKTCLTKCVNCERTIYTFVQKNDNTHLKMDYCEYCITDLSEEIKQELNHERVCIFNKQENKFILLCKK